MANEIWQCETIEKANSKNDINSIIIHVVVMIIIMIIILKAK